MSALAAALAPAPFDQGHFENAWRRAHETVTTECDEAIPCLTGSIPAGLRGSYYRIGPGRFERGATVYNHLFDGDGLVASFTFDERGVRYRSRFVRTRALAADEAHGTLQHRGFGTNKPGGLRTNAFRARFRNVSNTNVVQHGGRLLALWEGGNPYELDPVSLATRGPCDFEGKLSRPASLDAALFGRELPFSAHPKVDHATGELWNFGLRMGLRSRLMLYRADPAGRLDAPKSIDLDKLYFVHDFALTEHWLVFVLAPVSFQLGRMIVGAAAPADALRGQSGAETRVLLVEKASLRHGRPKVRWVLAGSGLGFIFHLAQGFETEDAGEPAVVLDVAQFPKYPVLPSLAGSAPFPRVEAPRLARLLVPLGASGRRAHVTSHSRAQAEFPITADAPAGGQRIVWALASPPRDSTCLSCIGRFDRESGSEQLKEFAPDVPSPPVFVQGHGSPPGEGYLLTTVYRSLERKSEFVVLDSVTLETLATCALPQSLPPSFHGTFQAANRPGERDS